MFKIICANLQLHCFAPGIKSLKLVPIAQEIIWAPFLYVIQCATWGRPFYTRASWPLEHSVAALPASPSVLGRGPEGLVSEDEAYDHKRASIRENGFSWEERCTSPTRKTLAFLPVYMYRHHVFPTTSAHDPLCNLEKGVPSGWTQSLARMQGLDFTPTCPLHLRAQAKEAFLWFLTAFSLDNPLSDSKEEG